jgi:transcriptional enhancer factor
MNDNFNNWIEVPMHLQQSSIMDSFAQGLATPPTTAGLQSPSGGNGFPFSQQRFDFPSENLSFVSNTTLDSESTLVNEKVANIKNFLANAQNVNLVDLDAHDATNWQLPTSESFDADPAWACGVPANTPAFNWDPDSKTQVWSNIPSDKQIEWPQDQNQKNHEEWREEPSQSNNEDWSQEPVPQNEDLQDSESTSVKKHVNFIEQNLEQKLIMMQEYRNPGESSQDSQDSFVEVQVSQLSDVDIDMHLYGNVEVTNGIMDDHMKELDWYNADDGFDYAQLAERLKG